MNSDINRILETAFEAAKEVRNTEKKDTNWDNWTGFPEELLRTTLFDEVAQFCISDCPRELLDVISAAAALFIRMTDRPVVNYSFAVRVSNTLKEEIEELISDKQLGFETIIQFVNDALRSRIDYYRDVQLMRKQRERATLGI
ncbi:MAG: hypothetical protein ACXACI_15160 [Candidatus Hodarchaeales archaeon]|jgi:hypothetical protein